MEIQREIFNSNMPLIEDDRTKTSLRIHYEAEILAIQKQIGDLEQIRGKLGLSQRKMAQLLMVDPSAWTRWTKKTTSTPPHIYRALQWYMILQDKLPGLSAAYFVNKDSEKVAAQMENRIRSEIERRVESEESLIQTQTNLLESNLLLNDEIRKIKLDNQKLQHWVYALALGITVVLVLFVSKLF